MRQICIGTKLQEASAKYCYEGWTWIYLACAGMDIQCLIDMLEAIFSNRPEIDPEELDSDAIKEMWAEAHKAKEEAAEREGRPVIADKNCCFQTAHCS